MSAVDVFAGMRLRCTRCRPQRTYAYRQDDDPDSVVRCQNCGKKHSRENLEVR